MYLIFFWIVIGVHSMEPNILLKMERDKRGWTQKEVADQIKAGEASYHRWESQGVLPTSYYRQELSCLFGKTIEELGLLPSQRSRSSPTDDLAPKSAMPSGAEAADKLGFTPTGRFFEHDDEEGENSPKGESVAQAYIDTNLTAQLLSLASTSGSSPDEVQRSLEQKLEVFGQNNPNKDVEQMQRSTLHIVAMNPLTSHINANLSRLPEVALNQSAAGITACDYLTNGSLEDRQLASSMLTAYFPVLQTVVSEMPRYRKEAAGLLSQIWQLKSRISFHFRGV